MTTIRVETYSSVDEQRQVERPPFWLLLGIGITWILLSFLLLQFTYTSIRAIAFLIGILMFLAAASEFAEALVAPGWKWVHGGMAVLFGLGGIWSFAYPGQTFGTLALLFGWYLTIKGTYDVVTAFSFHGAHLWWMGLVTGIAQIALAFWVVGYPGRSATLLVLWVGIGAALRGIMTIVVAFQVRTANRVGF